MNDYTEESLRRLIKDELIRMAKLREDGKVAAANKLRKDILELRQLLDAKQQERYQEYRLIASRTIESQTAEVSAEAASAVSEAERILGE